MKERGWQPVTQADLKLEILLPQLLECCRLSELPPVWASLLLCDSPWLAMMWVLQGTSTWALERSTAPSGLRKKTLRLRPEPFGHMSLIKTFIETFEQFPSRGYCVQPFVLRTL